LNAFFGLLPLVQGGKFVGPFVTDPGCYYDADTQRWFVDMSEIDNDGAGPGANIFVGVSTTPDPNGDWNIYAWSSDFNFGLLRSYPADCPCFGDYPQAGADKWSYTLTTNLYPLGASTTFQGAQVYALDKHGMAAGLNSVTLAYYNLNGVCAVDTPSCNLWYGLQPAKSPNSDYDTRIFTGLGAAPSDGLSAHGAEYMLSADDFAAFNVGGPTYANSITVWGLFGTELLLGSPGVPPLLGNSTLSSEGYGDPPFATQMNGPTPLRDCVDTVGCYDSKATPQPFGKIQTNDDSMQSTTYKFSEGEIFGALNTDVMVPSPAAASSAKKLVPALHAGIAYFVARLVGMPVIHRQGYVAAKGEDIMYPSIGLTTRDDGAMVFSLSGPDYWPSAAYTTWTGEDIITGPIHIALKGQAPQDGFTEYPYVEGIDRPRWGDFTMAATVGDKIYLETEYIGNQACSDLQFDTYDSTCGGTRTFFANWSNALIKVSP
jgi:hypothetical protein